MHGTVVNVAVLDSTGREFNFREPRKNMTKYKALLT